MLLTVAISAEADNIRRWRTLRTTDDHGSSKDMFCMQARMHGIHQAPTGVILHSKIRPCHLTFP